MPRDDDSRTKHPAHDVVVVSRVLSGFMGTRPAVAVPEPSQSRYSSFGHIRQVAHHRAEGTAVHLEL